MIEARFEPNLSAWRNEARRLLQLNTRPDQILWPQQDEQSLFFFEDVSSQVTAIASTQAFNVPKEFLTLAQFVSCHTDPTKWSLLYRILFRLKNETPNLLKIASDVDVQKANMMMKSVTRDIHKMHAFVRFKYVKAENGQEIYMAWHRPEHFILEESAPFFVRRFGDKPWCILTPDKSAFWDLKNLRFAEGVPQHLFKIKDDFDELWKTYYSSIFNPARIKIKAMKSEMAVKYWSTMPETQLIADLVRNAPARLEQMAKNQNVQAVVPPTNSLAELNAFAKKCTACPLFASATHTVCGEGPANAKMMIVGEQPGDQEDLAGKPFIGPAGEVLNDRLLEVGLQREEIYLTNAVKHFKWIPSEKIAGDGTRSGKLRKHSKASGTEMHACRPWLEEEIKKVKPKVIVALGLTAATSILGRLPKITQERGKIIRGSPYAEAVIISWHPAAILRSMDETEAAERRLQLAADLKLAADCLTSLNS